VWGVLKLVGRAAVWRTTPDPPLVGLPILLGFCVAVAAVRIALQLLAAGTWHDFNPYGLNAVVTWIALELAVAALFVRPAGRATALSAMFVLSILADLVTAAVGFALALIPAASAAAQSAFWNSAVAGGTIYFISVAWWVGSMACVVGSLESHSRLNAVVRVGTMWVALFAANAVVPHAPVFLPPHFDSRNANWWEILHALYQDKSGDQQTSAEVAEIEKAQPPLLEREVASLPQQRKGVTDIYAIGMAGWAEQDVFVKELDGGLQSLAAVLPIKNRIVRLINSRETVNNVPLADLKNFTAAVHAVGNIMDKDEDVLVVMMTSHGTQNGFALQLPTGPAELTPAQVASTFDQEGIKNRVVIVSACYAGIFVPPLKNDNTIVIAAADATHTSFGCAPERDWTYFGDAFFRQSLHPGSDFENAFDHARVLIQGWELMDHITPSNPQASFGAAIVSKLAPYFATNPGQ
jgi:Peptidase C13 family